MIDTQDWCNEATQLLTQLSNSYIRMYSTFDFGRQNNFECISAICTRDYAAANTIVLNLRKRLSPELIAFIGTTHWLGEERHDGVEVVIGKGNSQFDILHLAKTDAMNYGMSTEEVIEKLQEYNRDFGINIIHAETDSVEFTILNLPADLSKFAEDIYEFCPDIVDQGCGSIPNLIEAIEVTGKVSLWWD